jgi:hypothetical protein
MLIGQIYDTIYSKVLGSDKNLINCRPHRILTP